MMGVDPAVAALTEDVKNALGDSEQIGTKAEMEQIRVLKGILKELQSKLGSVSGG